jgi:YHS domain-containing protein
MNGFLSLLLFAVFFYLMMRFGCGAHMVHGGHGGHGGEGHEGHAGQEVPAVSPNDPVCGMSVEPGKGYSENYGGHEYHFCSKNCLDQFDAEPQCYASKKGERS